MMTRVKQCFYLDKQLSETLALLTLKPGTSKSQIVNDALHAFFAASASRQIDEMLRIRLDRISRDLGRSRRDIEVILESLSLFIRYQLTVTAPLPEGDAAARAIGRDRFEAFVAQVGRQLASTSRTFGDGTSRAAAE